MCLICDGERVVWERDSLGVLVCKPCPNCNKNGVNTANDLKKIKEEVEKLKCKS